MTITTGDKLPDATLLQMGDASPEAVELASLLQGKVAIFGLPGAYTGVCSTAHVPSFINAMDELAAKGVDRVICVSVNDPFVMKAWGEDTGASAAGIHMLADAEGALIRSMGLDFTAPPAGLIGRSKRFALLAQDGVIQILQVEDNPGQCGISSGNALLDAI